MSKPDLRLFRDPAAGEPAQASPSVKLRVKDVFPLLLHAHRHNFTWLKDLADDEILVTRDLAEVLAGFAEILDRKKGA